MQRRIPLVISHDENERHARAGHPRGKPTDTGVVGKIFRRRDGARSASAACGAERSAVMTWRSWGTHRFQGDADAAQRKRFYGKIDPEGLLMRRLQAVRVNRRARPDKRTRVREGNGGGR